MLGGVPLVVRVAQQASKVSQVEVVAVATDAPEIAAAVRGAGFTAVLTRSTHPSGTDRVAEAAEALDAEFIINAQGDEPFLQPADLAAIADALRRDDADIVTLSRPITRREDFENPNVVKVVCRDDGRALYFSRAPIPYPRRGEAPPPGACRHIGVYGFRRRALRAMCHAAPHPLEQGEGLEQLRALAMGLSIAVLPARTDARGIDTEEDLAWARDRVARLGGAAFP
jgi:3-deoxy-manno-octulosonate cytidylyltransferase (CMP-KDO synthetase)